MSNRGGGNFYGEEDMPVDDQAIATKRARKPRGPARRRPLDVLRRAETLRPADVYAEFGIPQTTLNDWCTKLPDDHRLPSLKIGAWRGRKGIRLVYRSVLKSWLAWQSRLAELAARGETRPDDEATFALWHAKHERLAAAKASLTTRKGRAA